MSPKGNLVAVVSRDSTDSTVRGEATVHDATTGAVRFTLAGQSWSRCRPAFSADGALVAFGRNDGRVIVYGTADWSERAVIRASTVIVSTVAFSPDGKRLATGGIWESGARVWDVATGQEVVPATGHAGGVDGITLSADGRTLHSWSRDKRVCRWDTATGDGKLAYQGPGDGMVYGWSALAPGGDVLATMSYTERKLNLIDVASGTPLRTLTHYPPDVFRSTFLFPAAFSPDGKRLAAAEGTSGVRVWDVGTGKAVATWDQNRLNRPVGSVEFTPDGKAVVIGLKTAATGAGGYVEWEPDGNRTRRWHNFAQRADLVVRSPDGGRFATAAVYADSNTVGVHDAATGKKLYELNAHRQGCYRIAFSPDGRLLATLGAEKDDRVCVWDAATGQELGTFRGHHSGVMVARFGPDGRTLYTGAGDSSVLAWDLTGRAGGLGPVPANLDDAWAKLALASGSEVLPAVFAFADDPDRAIPFLRERLKPVATPDPAAVAALVRKLDSPAFPDREAASAGLLRLGQGVIPDLKTAVAKEPSNEVRDRLTRLLSRLETGAEATLDRRAVHALSLINRPESRNLIENLATGRADTPLTGEARRASGR